MAFEVLRRLAAPGSALLLAACAAPAPFPLLGEAGRCIEAAQADNAARDAGELLTDATAYAGAARRSSTAQEAEHYAHLALQRCRTARALGEARRREERIANLELTRLHLQAGLRALDAETAGRQARALSSRLGLREEGSEVEVAIPIERKMFGRGGRGLRPASAPLIREVAAFLRQHRRWQVSVASGAGAQARNGAASVRHSLVARGLAPERVLLQPGLDTGFVYLLIVRPH